MSGERVKFELSGLSYTEFVQSFFDGPFDESKANSIEISDPGVMLAHLRRTCAEFGELARTFSFERLDHGLWGVFGPRIDCERVLFDAQTDLAARIECVESLYVPFREVVSGVRGEIRETFYWMWWDLILWGRSSTDLEPLLDAILRTLGRILELDHRGCQWCALHGLGHLRHVRANTLVQDFLDRHRSTLSEDEVKWVEECRENRIL